MKIMNLFMCFCALMCGITAVLIAGEILPPIELQDLSVGFLIMMALFCAHLAIDYYSGDDDGEDQE